MLDMARRTVDVAVIIPDASPVLTLARIGRIDLLGSFTVPVRIVDQVRHEITKPENDPKGEVAAALARLHNQIEIVETNVGVGYQTRRAPVTRESRAATLARSPWTNTPRLWRGAPAPVLCRWCFSKTPM
jgi:hypothetical protein